MPRILVLDDEDDILYLVEAILQMEGHEVRTAKTKSQFLEILNSFQPHLVILDVMIKGDDGREICREIKAAEHRHIPVILYSANPKLLENFSECSANYIIEKPFEMKHFIDKIKEGLSHTSPGG